MLTSVSKRMAGEFFGNVDQALSGTLPAAVAASSTPGEAPVAGQVFTAPASFPAISSHSDFVKGIALGAGLVVLGVVVGSLFGRRR
jgi:hypothetical protein